MGYSGGEVLKIHLEFKKQPLQPGKKMHKFIVHNKTFNEDIGILHFRGGWRQYVFRADPDIDMTKSCHKEIDDFMLKTCAESYPDDISKEELGTRADLSHNSGTFGTYLATLKRNGLVTVFDGRVKASQELVGNGLG